MDYSNVSFKPIIEAMELEIPKALSYPDGPRSYVLSKYPDAFHYWCIDYVEPGKCLMMPHTLIDDLYASIPRTICPACLEGFLRNPTPICPVCYRELEKVTFAAQRRAPLNLKLRFHQGRCISWVGLLSAQCLGLVDCSFKPREI